MTELRASLFRTIGRVSATLPAFRGRARIFLVLFNALGLESQHVFVETTLRRPVPFRVSLDLHSWLQRLAFLTGDYESEIVTFLLELYRALGRSGPLLDIGANVGLLSLPAALMLPKSAEGSSGNGPRVIAVEAVASNVSALRHNVALNGAEDLITVLEVGLGDVVKTVEIQVEGDLSVNQGSGTANIMPEGSTYECVRIPLQLSTLDVLMESGALATPCPLIKIDTDGYDLNVLKGGTRFFDKNRPTVFGEFAAHCLRWHDQTILDVARFASTVNYQVWQKRPGTALRFTRELTPDRYEQDLLLVPSEAADALAWCCDGA